MRRYTTAALVIIMVCMFAVTAQAGIPGWDAVKGWFDDNVVAMVVTALLAIGGIGAFVLRFTPVIGSIGWFLVTIDNVFSDKKLTKEEWTELKAKFNAIAQSAKAAKHG